MNNNKKLVAVSEDPSLTFGMTLDFWSHEGEGSGDSTEYCLKMLKCSRIAASFPLSTPYILVIPSVSEESSYQL
jgi:hypothetical protein